MRLFLAFLPLLFIGFAAHAQQAHINWMTLEEAMAAQADEPRTIMMDVYTQWCGPCKMMMANTFTQPALIAYLNEHYYAVKFDAESAEPVTFKGQTFTNPGFNPAARGRNAPHELSRALGVSAYPTLLFLTEKGDIITPLTGYKSAQQLEIFLKFFAEVWQPGSGQAEWDAYQAAFQGTF